MATYKLCVYKADQSQKLGVSFCAFEEPGARVQVRAVAPDSLAATSGLMVGDIVTQINKVSAQDALDAARLLRESEGEIWLIIERHIGCDVGDDDDDESVDGLSPPRQIMSPPKSIRLTMNADMEPLPKWIHDEQQQQQRNKSIEELRRTSPMEESSRSEDEGEEGSASAEEEGATAEEWEDWLVWMISRIEEREGELTELQSQTADCLAESMGGGGIPLPPPSPPSELEMADPVKVGEYMEMMAAYSMRQQQALKETCAREAIENREAMAAIALLAARRQELLAFLDRVEELTEEDASRVEEIWAELAHDTSSDEDDEGWSGEEGEQEEEEEEESRHDDEEESAGDRSDEADLQDGGEGCAQAGSAGAVAAEVATIRAGPVRRGMPSKVAAVADTDAEVDRILSGADCKPQPRRAAAPPPDIGTATAPPAGRCNDHADAANRAAADARSEPSSAVKALARSASFGRRRGLGARSLSDRVVTRGPEGKALRVAQRLQRARSSGGLLSAAPGQGAADKADPFINEVGVRVHPL